MKIPCAVLNLIVMVLYLSQTNGFERYGTSFGLPPRHTRSQGLTMQNSGKSYDGEIDHWFTEVNLIETRK